MREWEYKTIELKDPMTLSSALNEWGRDGWMIMSVVPATPFSNKTKLYYLGRPKEPKDVSAKEGNAAVAVLQRLASAMKSKNMHDSVFRSIADKNVNVFFSNYPERKVK